MTTKTKSDPDSRPAAAGAAGTVAVGRDDGIVTIRLGDASESVVTLTEERLRSLEAALDELAREPELLGVVVTGPGPRMFAAGADIRLIEAMTDVQQGIEAAAFGQRLFGRLADLGVPTVAAIEGPCLGGGLELALGCTTRIASEDPSTKIGLPEVKLGIVPGFGGTQRLTRLVGLPKALDLILQGKLLDARRAAKLGVVDRTVPGERLLEAARAELESLRGGGRRRRRLRGADRWLTGLPPLRALIANKVAKTLGRGQARFYEAPRRALDLCLDAVRTSPEQGFANEARALGELIVSPTSKALVHLYFLTERAKRLGKGSAGHRPHSACVVGGGVMGAGIAGLLATKGLTVRLCDVDPTNLAGAKARLQKGLDKKCRRRRLQAHEARAIQDRLAVAGEWGSLRRCELFLEAVPEQLELKRALFRRAVEHGLPDGAVIATNTSSLPIEVMAEGLPAPERVVGIHFFNPPEKMPLVEVVVGANTAQPAVDAACALAVALGKYPVVVEDRPGFLVNRCLAPYLDEAGRLLLEGHAPEFVDRVMLDFGMPMGPARLLDEIGFDVAAKVGEVLSAAFPDRMQPSPLFAAMVEAGCLGSKGAGGFYDARGRRPGPGRAVLARMRPTGATGGASRSEVTARLVYRMVDEAYRCLDDGVVGATEDLDLGLVMGIGFAPFTGGITRFAEREGIGRIVAELERLAARHGDRFAPGPALRRRA